MFVSAIDVLLTARSAQSKSLLEGTSNLRDVSGFGANDCPGELSWYAAKPWVSRAPLLPGLELLPQAGYRARLLGRIVRLNKQSLLLFGRRKDDVIRGNRWI